jgi:hypothetical protein
VVDSAPLAKFVNSATDFSFCDKLLFSNTVKLQNVTTDFNKWTTKRKNCMKTLTKLGSSEQSLRVSITKS